MDAIDRVVRDAVQHGAEVEFRIESVKPGGADRGIGGRGPFSSGI